MAPRWYAHVHAHTETSRIHALRAQVRSAPAHALTPRFRHLAHRSYLLLLSGKLKTVFPLVRTAEPDVAYTIAGLSLPNTDFTGCDEEEIAAALGCVAHVLLILARWFDVPLRYTILFLGSRSVILDEIAHSSSPRYPHTRSPTLATPDALAPYL